MKLKLAAVESQNDKMDPVNVPHDNLDEHAQPPARRRRPDARRISALIRNDVVPKVDEYWRQPIFQNHAAYHIRTLKPDARTPERQLVDSTKSAMIEFAQLLSGLAQKRMIARRLNEQFVLTGTDVEMELNQVGCLEHDCHLVNVADYFCPVQEFVNSGEQRVQRAELITCFNPEIPAIGNIVVATLVYRAESRFELLRRCWSRVQSAVAATGHSYTKAIAQLNEIWTEVADRVGRLRTTLLYGPENRIRTSCVVLTQIYTACYPTPDCNWLGVDNAVTDQGRHIIKHSLTRPSQEIVDRIATALKDLNELPKSGGSSVQAAIVTGGLVVVSKPDESGEIWWRQERISAVEKGMPFKALFALARKSRLSASVTEADLYSESVSDQAMSTLFGRLKSRLPLDLSNHVVPGDGVRSYRLTLDTERVHVFEE